MKYIVQITDSNGEPMYWIGYKFLRAEKPFATWSPRISSARTYNNIGDARQAIGEISDFFGVQSYKVIHVADKVLFDYKLRGV